MTTSQAHPDPARTARRMPWGLAGMLLALIAIEAGLAKSRPKYATDRLLEWTAFEQRARTVAKDAEILCVGDSLLKVGLLPKVVETRTGKSTYNLALGYGQAPSTYFMLRNALDAGCKPSAVIVDFKWTGLATGLRADDKVYPTLMNPGDMVDVAGFMWREKPEKSIEQVATMLLSRALPSFQGRDDLRHNVMAILTNTTSLRRDENSAWRIAWDVNRGTCLAPVRPEYHGEVDVNDGYLLPEDWKCTAMNESYVERFFELTTARSIPVVWVLPPVNPLAFAELEKRGAARAYDDFVRRITAKFPGVTIVDGRRSGYDVSLFVDPTHLNRNGAEIFSADLGEAVRKATSRAVDLPGRWVQLPTCGRRETGVAIIDVSQVHSLLKARK